MFETCKVKAISKRQLQMKKIIKGKLNTLNKSKDKVSSVAKDIITAVKQAKEDDTDAKQMIDSSPPEFVKGTKFLLDLLASNMMERIQKMCLKLNLCKLKKW